MTRQPLVRLLGLALLAFSLLCQPADAQTAPSVNGVDTSSFFTIPATDKSNELLGIIFGSEWFSVSGTQPEGGTPSNSQVGLNTGTSGNSGILGAMSMILNAACMLVAVTIVTWATTTGVMHTAHEGVALGKKYSTLWFPLRSALAMAMLAPLAGGYSMIQVAAMQFTKVSIGVANATYGQMIQYMGSGNAFGMAQVPEGKDLAEGLLRAEACQLFINQSYSTLGYGAAINKTASGPTTQTIQPTQTLIASGGNLSQPASTVASYNLSFDGSTTSGYTSAVCGRVTYSTEYAGVQTGAKASYASQRWAAVQQLDQQMATLAAAILSGQSFTAHSGDFFNAVQTYQNSVLSAGASYQSTINATEAGSGGSTRAGQALASLNQGGWIYAGSFYWQMANTARKLSDVMDGTASISAQPQDGLSGTSVPALDEGFKQYEMGPSQRIALYIKSYAINPLAGNSTATASNQPETDGSVSVDTNSVFKKLANKIFVPLTQYFFNAVADPTGDSISKMANIGHYMIGISEAGYVATAVAASIPDAVNKTGVGVIANFFTGIPQAANALMKSALGPLKIILMIMMVLGIWMAFWLPSIPFIMWIAACTGWIIAVVQAVISAPIWAAAHAAPEGDGFAGQQARNGYMLVISLMLRPTLMLFGMVGGMLVMQAAGALIWLLFPSAFSDIVGDSIFGAVSFLSMIIILCVIISATAHRAFELSYDMADQILKWIGGGIEQLGARESAAHAQATFLAAFSRARPIKAPASASASPGRPPRSPRGISSDARAQTNKDLL